MTSKELFEAMADEDVLGLIATLDAGERDTIAGPVEQLFDELERLEVLDDSFQLDGVDGAGEASGALLSVGDAVTPLA